MQTESVQSSPLAQLAGFERALLALPMLGGLFFGLFPLLLPQTFADVARFPAEGLYIYQLAGAATLGYGVGLLFGLLQRSWRAVRLPVIATLVFNLASLYACAVEIAAGHAPYTVYVILVASSLFVAISILLLARHRGSPQPAQNLATPAVRLFLVIGAVSAATFGILPLLLPQVFTNFGLPLSITFIGRQGGAASLGYAVMAIFALRALSGVELRLPIIMAGVFNGASALVSIPYLFSGAVPLLPWIIAPFGLAVAVGAVIALRRISALPSSD
ncbi:MAG TPA: hypothetical protein VH349_18610 [Ktedonobacterales bacterium]|jgi:hypothetical protein